VSRDRLKHHDAAARVSRRTGAALALAIGALLTAPGPASARACEPGNVCLGRALAPPPGSAEAGLEAMGRGDNEAAVHEFTQALLYGSQARSDRELAYVKRAEAFLALRRNSDALADARRALALDPGDAEALEVRGDALAAAGARPSFAPAPAKDASSDVLNAKVKAGLDAVAARNAAAYEAYQAQSAAYEARLAAIEADKKAGEEAYAASLAAHQARIEAMEQQRAAIMADWEARVVACKSGDRSKCAPPPSAQKDQGAP
jgi:tetratricopeptide (TPR) repeat protein